MKLSSFKDRPVRLSSTAPLSCARRNVLVHNAGLFDNTPALKDFQMQCSNLANGRMIDMVVIAPTGSEKSMLWALSLLVHKVGISLVVTPYTNLGTEGEQRYESVCVVCDSLY